MSINSVLEEFKVRRLYSIHLIRLAYREQKPVGNLGANGIDKVIKDVQ